MYEPLRLPVRNVSGEIIPARALMRVTGQDTYANGGAFTVDKPNSDGQLNILVNGKVPIPIGATIDLGGHAASPCMVLYDTADGTPAAGETWGAENGSWKANKNKAGGYVLSTGDSTAAMVNLQHAFMRLTSSFSGITVEEQDGAPSYSSTTTLQFEESDGFVVSQPAANKALVRLTGDITQNLTFTGVQTFSNDVVISDVIVSNSVTWLQVVTLSSSQNNYSVGAGVLFLIINATANINITGIAISGGNTIDRPLTILNVGAANTVTLVNASGSSSAANQFTLPAASNITLAAAGGQVQVFYNAANTTWYTSAMTYPAVASLSGTAALSANVLTMLASANNAAILSNIGAQTLDATLTAFAALTIVANSITVGTGADAFSQLTLTANTFPAIASSGNVAAKPITDFGLSVVAAASNSALGAIVWTTGTLAAAGSVQGDAAAIVDSGTDVSGADGTKGVILPATGGGIYLVYNQHATNTLKVYPPSGAQISANGTNNPESILGLSKTTFIRLSSTQWYRLTTT